MCFCTDAVVLPAIESFDDVMSENALAQVARGDASLRMEEEVEVEEKPSSETRL